MRDLYQVYAVDFLVLNLSVEFASAQHRTDLNCCGTTCLDDVPLSLNRHDINVGREMKLMLILDNFCGVVPLAVRTEMRGVSRQRKYFRLSVLGCFGPLLWVAPPAPRELQIASEEYQMRIQQVADTVCAAFSRGSLF